jgi:hypothetical protein
MKILYPLLLCALLFAGACSYFFPPRVVECCENKAACCFDQMCCLPRYAQAAGVELKPFTTNLPTYGSTREQDLDRPGSVIVKKGWLAKVNPFGESETTPPPQAPPQDTSTSSGSDKRRERLLGAVVAVLMHALFSDQHQNAGVLMQRVLRLNRRDLTAGEKPDERNVAQILTDVRRVQIWQTVESAPAT